MEVSPPLFKLCTPTSALLYQQQFSAVTQHRQESSMHTNTTMLPLSAHIAYTWFKFVGSEVRHRWIIIIGQTWGRRREWRGRYITETRTVDLTEVIPGSRVGHYFDWSYSISQHVYILLILSYHQLIRDLPLRALEPWFEEMLQQYVSRRWLIFWQWVFNAGVGNCEGPSSRGIEDTGKMFLQWAF